MSAAQDNLPAAPAPRRKRRWSWKRTAWLTVGLAVLACVLMVILPQLVPGAALRRQVQSALSQRLGRPVTITAASFRWGEGLKVTGLVIGQGGPAGDAPLATIDEVTVRFDPFLAARSLTGGQVPLDFLGVRGLQLWLTVGPDGRWNVQDLMGEPLKVRSIQVSSATIHVTRAETGRTITLVDCYASAGELASTGHGYVNVVGRVFQDEAAPAAGQSGGQRTVATLPTASAAAPATPESTDRKAAPPPGTISITANLSRLYATGQEPLTGTLKTEWTAVAWPQLVSLLGKDSPLVNLVKTTSGRMSTTFSRDAWTAEGSVNAYDVTLALEGLGAQVTVPEAIVGFQLRQAGGDKPVEVHLVKVTAPGVDLRISGSVRAGASRRTDAGKPPLTPAPDAAASSATVGQDSAGRPRAEVSAPTQTSHGPERARVGRTPLTVPSRLKTLRHLVETWNVRDLDLDVRGTITWVPLCQSLPALQEFSKRFEQLGGGADVHLHLETAADGPLFTASVNLRHTMLRWRGVVDKSPGDVLWLDMEAWCPRDFSQVQLRQMAVVTAAGRAVLTAHAPMDSLVPPPEAADGTTQSLSRRLADAQAEATISFDQLEKLLALVPCLKTCLGPLETSGPLEVRLVLTPVAGSEPAPAGPADTAAPQSRPLWVARLSGDLTKMHVRMLSAAAAPGRNESAPSPEKPAGKRATLEALAVIDPDACRLDLQHLRLTLDKGSLTWNGRASLARPWASGRPPAGPLEFLTAAHLPAVGDVEGTITLVAAESIGAIVAPGVFSQGGPHARPADTPPQAPPLTGEAIFTVAGTLTDEEVRGRLEASLQDLGIRAEDYLVKPVGQPARFVLSAVWHRKPRHRLEAETGIELPGAISVHCVGKGESQQFDLLWGPPQNGQSGPGGRRPAIRFAAAPGSTAEVHVDSPDLARALAVSPFLARMLGDYKASGGASADLLLSVRPEDLQGSATLDLTDSSIDLGRYLKKPAGQTLRADVVAVLSAPKPGAIEARLTAFEARLGRTTVSAEGRVQVDQEGLATLVQHTAARAAILKDADLRIRAAWVHDEDLRRSLPWLEPLYAACGLTGPTRLTASLVGTPLRGRIRLDADATRCRITSGDAIVKPPGTKAAAHLEVRYGEVPGEMILDRLAVELADASATIDGRLLFDSPRLLRPALPAAWSLHARGQVPEAAILASLFPARLADLKPAGAVTFDVKASADTKTTEVESCSLAFRKARLEWLGRSFMLDGPVSYDSQRLATDGLNIAAAGSDVTLVAYIANPNSDPAGAVFVRGPRLDLKEAQDFLREASEYLAARRRPAGLPPAAGPRQPASSAVAASASAEAALAAAISDKALSDRVARRVQRILAGAQLSVEIGIDRVILAIPQWNTVYEPQGLVAEGRLADRQLVVPDFHCTLNDGTITGEMVLDFRQDVPVVACAYDARDLRMADNLKPFIDTTFPGMSVYGTLSTRQSLTLRLEQGAYPVGRGETVLTDGLLVGPAAPEYITNLLPGLKLTQYRFNRMSNVFENRPSGEVDNRMLFNGRTYDIFIFGSTLPDGRIDYTLGVDLTLAVGSKVISRTLDQGKLPILYFTGRIVGTQYAEQNVRYVLPHEFAYDVFIRRNLLIQVIRSLGEKPPEIERPRVVPDSRRQGA